MSRHGYYARMRDLDQAAELLGALDTGATLIAGGQELMPAINYGHLTPSVLVDISGIAALRGISIEGGVVTLGAATCHDAYKYHEAMLTVYDPGSLILGGVFAFISAVIAVKWMVAYLNKHGLAVFGYYRVALAVVVAFLIMTRQIIDSTG